MAMLVISLVAGGVLTAFAFSRQLMWRTDCELAATNLSQDIADRFREQPMRGWGEGIYVSQGMLNPPQRGPWSPQERAQLNMPGFGRFLTSPGTARDFANHGDGRVLIVEDLTDIDGDGVTGIDFNGDGRVDLRRIRVKTRWTSP